MEIVTTRVKKYKKYRKKIAKNSLLYHPNSNLHLVEKLIGKVKPELLANNFAYQIQLLPTLSKRQKVDNETLLLLQNYLAVWKSYHFDSWQEQINIFNDTKTSYNTLDQTSNFDVIWLAQDTNYDFLLQQKNWLQTMHHNYDQIIQQFAEKLALFEQHLQNAQNPAFGKSFLLNTNYLTKVNVRTKNKKLFYFLFVTFLVFVTAAIVFLLLFFFLG